MVTSTAPPGRLPGEPAARQRARHRHSPGGAHLHIWIFARPEGQAQLYGSWLVVWDDLLPEYPAEAAEADAAVVADALIASHGGHRQANG